jgi:hypothetical protein
MASKLPFSQDLWFLHNQCEDYILMGCDPMQSGTYMPTVQWYFKNGGSRYLKNITFFPAMRQGFTGHFIALNFLPAIKNK